MYAQLKALKLISGRFNMCRSRQEHIAWGRRFIGNLVEAHRRLRFTCFFCNLSYHSKRIYKYLQQHTETKQAVLHYRDIAKLYLKRQVLKFRTIICSDNGLSPGRRQAVIWTNSEILLILTLGTHFREILSMNDTFLFKKMHLKISFAKWRQFCIGLSILGLCDRSGIMIIYFQFVR